MLHACCFCVRLRTACLAIGYTYIGVNIATLLAWLTFSVCVAATTTEDEYNSHDVPRQNLILFFVYILLPLLAVCGGCIVVCVQLIRGVNQHQRRLMLPWLVWYGLLQSIWTVLWLVFSVWTFCQVGHYKQHQAFTAVVGVTVLSSAAGLVVLGVLWLWYMAVVAHYDTLAPSERYMMQTLQEPELRKQLAKADDADS